MYGLYVVPFSANLQFSPTYEMVTVLHGSRDVGGVAGKPREEREPE